MQGMGCLIHFAKTCVVLLYRVGCFLLPFQTQWVANRLLRGKHGIIVCRLLTLSMDWPETDGCETFWNAVKSDFSSKRFHLRDGRMRFNHGTDPHPVCFLDVTNYYRHDDKTGLHRRIYELLRVLLVDKDLDCRAVYCNPRTEGYQYANRLVQARFPEAPVYSDPVVFQKGDKLVLMQAAVPDGVSLSLFAEQGIAVVAVVDDVIPIQHPEMVKSNIGFIHAFRDIMANASLVLSVSMTAVEEIKQCAKDHGYEVNSEMQYGCFYNGCDFKKPEGADLDASEQALVDVLKGKRFVFSVGTFEPRKGYGEAIKAFELLWKQGSDVSYVIAGRVGMSTGTFVADCKRHPEYGKHLLLAVGASDLLLSKLYEMCLFVLNCSHAEGFGIPLMEATFYRKPILARRLPVFEEIMKDQIRYFEDSSPDVLAGHLEKAMRDVATGVFVSADKTKISYYSWDEVGKLFKDRLIRE